MVAVCALHAWVSVHRDVTQCKAHTCFSTKQTLALLVDTAKSNSYLNAAPSFLSTVLHTEECDIRTKDLMNESRHSTCLLELIRNIATCLHYRTAGFFYRDLPQSWKRTLRLDDFFCSHSLFIEHNCHNIFGSIRWGIHDISELNLGPSSCVYGRSCVKTYAASAP